MVHDEKGFTYPLTFCILLLVSVLLSIQLEQYLSEKRFMRESELILKQEYYFLSSIKQAENQLRQMLDDELPAGASHFSDGEVVYRTEKLTDSLFKVTFELKMASLPILLGFGYYDKEEGRMIKWIEKN